MDDTVLPSDWHFQIKAATRDLIRRAGGLVRAGEITDRGKSTVERWGSSDHPDIIPIPCAMMLEHDTGTAFVTAAMAAITGRVLAERTTDIPVGGVLRASARAAKEAADVLAATAEALADGVVTPNEARLIEREAAEAQEAIGDLRKTVAASSGGQTLQVVS